MNCRNLMGKLLLPVLLPVLFLLSCEKDPGVQPTPTPPAPPAPDTTFYSFLALGDSYTVGQGVPREESWPFQLQVRLRENNLFVDPLTVIARTGWTTENLINDIETDPPGMHDMVSLLIGVNDQYQNKPFSTFQAGFDELLNKAIVFAGGVDNVIVISIPDYGVTPFGSSNSEAIAEEIDQFNDYIRERCEDLFIPFIDVTQISRDLGNGSMALATDNLHPSGFQYSLWVGEILPVAIEILKN